MRVGNKLKGGEAIKIMTIIFQRPMHISERSNK
jgi:hypothetical protein